MPARQRGWARNRKNGWQACWREGGRQRTGPHLFPSKTAAEDWLDDYFDGGAPRRGRHTTVANHIERYLRVHAATVDESTIRTLRARLGAHEETAGNEPRQQRRAYQTFIEAFGDLTLAEIEHMGAELAEWRATIPEGFRYAVMGSVRQALNAGVRWRIIRINPAKEAGPNPQPQAGEVSCFQSLADVDRVAVELGSAYGPIVIFGCETGLMPSEWAALERRDIDREALEVRVRRFVVDGRVKEVGKTSRRRRAVPLTTRAIAAIDLLPARIDTPVVFPAARGGHIDLHNWRGRHWRPAIDAAGLAPGLHPYSMRHTYAAFALDAGVSIFELARLMGTSVEMIDRTYGHLVRGSHDHVRAKLEARARREAAEAVGDG